VADKMAVVETMLEVGMNVTAANQTGLYSCKAENVVGADKGNSVFLGVLCEYSH
jgi:hypothetical protein